MQVELKSWNDLKHIDEVSPGMADEAALFDEIRQVLNKHGAVDRYGLCLLHKHFEIEEDEVLVETCDMENRTLTVQPVKKRRLSERSVVQTVWSLVDGVSPIIACKLVCYRDEDGFHEKKHWP